MNQDSDPVIVSGEQSSKKELLRSLIKSRLDHHHAPSVSKETSLPDRFIRIEKLDHFQELEMERAYGEKIGLKNPYYILHEGVARDTTMVMGSRLLNFATYNYLGLNGDRRVDEAAIDSIQKFGTSASASRLSAGERPPHRMLENELSDFLGTEDTVVFVSGHAACSSTIATIAGPKDLVIHDRLIHNSSIVGAINSGAQRLAFPHNDMEALNQILSQNRHRFEKVLIVVEGIYSMDGDLVPLPEIVHIKKKHGALLFLDEAHSIGAIGSTGRGVTEHFQVPVTDVDILMGTLSKTFAGCGGFVSGSSALTYVLKYKASGLVYSVGMPPPVAAASHAALVVMRSEPERIQKLQKNGRMFWTLLRENGLNTGFSQGFHIVPVIIGSSIKTIRLANQLMNDGILASPVTYPGVEERTARLRFFISSDHTSDQIEVAVNAVADLALAR